jgi:hypothetical protein
MGFCALAGTLPWPAVILMGAMAGFMLPAAIAYKSGLALRTAFLFTCQTLLYFSVGYWGVLMEFLAGRIPSRQRRLPPLAAVCPVHCEAAK